MFVHDVLAHAVKLYPEKVALRDGDGHVAPTNFARDAWAFLSGRRLP